MSHHINTETKNVSYLNPENKNCIFLTEKKNGTFTQAHLLIYITYYISNPGRKNKKASLSESQTAGSTWEAKDGETGIPGPGIFHTVPCRELLLLFLFHLFCRGLSTSSFTIPCFFFLCTSRESGICLCAHPCDTFNPLLLILLSLAFS